MRQAAFVAFLFVMVLVSLHTLFTGIDDPSTVGAVRTFVGWAGAVFIGAFAIDAAATLVLDRLADVVDAVLDLTGEDGDDA